MSNPAPSGPRHRLGLHINRSTWAGRKDSASSLDEGMKHLPYRLFISGSRVQAGCSLAHRHVHAGFIGENVGKGGRHDVARVAEPKCTRIPALAPRCVAG